MNHLHKRRLSLIILFILGLTIATTLVLYALKQNMNAFLTPSQVAMQSLPTHYYFRLGGMVKKKSVVRNSQTLTVTFVVTDLKKELSVQYTGILPDLFREGKGVVADGHLNDQGIFIASEVLAKHDENYMPKPIHQATQS